MRKGARLAWALFLMTFLPNADLHPAEQVTPLAQQLCPERQISDGHRGLVLTNFGVWSPDGQWIVYDTRSEPSGAVFDGTTIEMIHVSSGAIRELYRSQHGAHCGVVSFHPTRPEVAFILGPEHPTSDWSYNAFHRHGVVVRLDQPQLAVPIDARDLVPPFTPGALRGGSHVHIFSPDGELVSFTYEDHVLARWTEPGPGHDINQRNLGVASSVRPVPVPPTHPRNHSGSHFSVLVSSTTARPQPGDLVRACEEGWVGTHGYLRADGQRQRYALAFQGHVRSSGGTAISEVYIVDLPDDLTLAGARPLAGTETTMPAPPHGTTQRRLTHTENRAYPGIQGPRHWLRSSPDGEQIAFLMRDDAGIVQLWTISPRGGLAIQCTRNPYDIASAFTWSPDGRFVAHVLDGSVCITEMATGITTRLTPRTDPPRAPRPEACVFSPDGRQIAFVRGLVASGAVALFTVDCASLTGKGSPEPVSHGDSACRISEKADAATGLDTSSGSSTREDFQANRIR
jgi:hypothetical protein